MSVGRENLDVFPHLFFCLYCWFLPASHDFFVYLLNLLGIPVVYVCVWCGIQNYDNITTVCIQHYLTLLLSSLSYHWHFSLLTYFRMLLKVNSDNSMTWHSWCMWQLVIELVFSRFELRTILMLMFRSLIKHLCFTIVIMFLFEYVNKKWFFVYTIPKKYNVIRKYTCQSDNIFYVVTIQLFFLWKRKYKMNKQL